MVYVCLVDIQKNKTVRVVQNRNENLGQNNYGGNQMSIAEHLIENALTALEEGKDFEYFKKDTNFEFAPSILPEEIWDMAQYVYYTYLPYFKSQMEENDE